MFVQLYTPTLSQIHPSLSRITDSHSHRTLQYVQIVFEKGKKVLRHRYHARLTGVTNPLSETETEMNQAEDFFNKIRNSQIERLLFRPFYLRLVSVIEIVPF